MNCSSSEPSIGYYWRLACFVLGMKGTDGAKSHPELSGGFQGPDTMPSNVSELLTRAQLDNARDVYRLIESRSELNPYQERELAAKIINKLVDYHSTTIEKLIEENKAETIAGWAIDLQRLRSAVELLEGVDLSDD